MLRTRDLALVSAFAAVLVVYGYVSSPLRPFTRSTELFFLISVLFAVLAIIVHKSGVVSLVATVAGIVYLAIPGAPFPLHIAASLISNGLAFDLYLKAMGGLEPLSPRRIAAAGAVGSLVMAVVGLTVFQISGTNLTPIVWVLAIVIDTPVGWLGARFGLHVARRIESTTTVSVSR